VLAVAPSVLPPCTPAAARTFACTPANGALQLRVLCSFWV